MESLYSVIDAIRRSERGVVILGGFVFCCIALFFSGKTYLKIYDYYSRGVVVTATIFDVEEYRKYNNQIRKWETYLESTAEYRVGNNRCFVKLRRVSADQSGYDLVREGAKRELTYLPDEPCRGELKPYAGATLANIFTAFSLLILFLLIVVVPRSTKYA